MTVYVDDMVAPFKRGSRTYNMCHMIATDIDELHAMAVRLGVRQWFQNSTSGPHYDIAQTKRALALTFGAVPITWMQCAAMCMYWRKFQAWPEPPADAMAFIRELKKGAQPAGSAP